MHVPFAIALLGFGIAGATAASATDLPIAHSGTYSARYFEYGRQSAMLWIYDDQPGVVVRAYWRAPWRHHHYFPATGEAPDIGRDEDLSVTAIPPKPAKTFRRTWSNSSAFAHEEPASAQPDNTQAQPQSQSEPQSQPMPRMHRSHRFRKR